MPAVLEQFANNPVSTLNGAINNSTTTVVVTDASTFPASGDYSIIVDTEIMRVTARSSNTLTVVRGQEGTAAASHLDLAAISVALTKRALLKGFADLNMYDTYANRPSAAQAGRIFTPSDFKGVKYYDDGSNWKIVPEDGFPYASPNLAQLTTWANQQNATITQVQDFIRFEDDGTSNSGEDWRLYYKSTSAATSITIITAGRLHHNNLNPAVASHIYRTAGGAFFEVGVIKRAGDPNLRIHVARFTDPNNFAGDTSEFVTPMSPYLYHVKSELDVGTGAFTISFSLDGAYWVRAINTTPSLGAAVTGIGVGVNNYNPAVSGDKIAWDIYKLDIAEV